MTDRSDYERAREIALHYLGHSARSCIEVSRRLARADVSEEVVLEVLSDLQRAGLVDDAVLSRDWVESRARSKGLGARRLQAELSRKGIAKPEVEAALEQLSSEDQISAALELCRRRLRGADTADAAERRRLAGFLGRKGYNWEIISQVFSRLFSNDT